MTTNTINPEALMQTALEQAQGEPTAAPERLPELREELNLLIAAPGQDGSPRWSLHDPVRNQFFSVDWATFEILSRWMMGEAAPIVDAVNAETTLDIAQEDVDEVKKFLLQNQLCQLHHAQGTAWLCNREKALHNGFWHWVLHHYLFFRIPLVRPDRWLDATLKWVAPLYTRAFFHLTLMALVLGLFQCYRQWGHFSATLVDTFSLQGALGYAVALVFVKILHELGHAYTAKRKGCRVPTMGLAFLVMMPVAYTDVNEVWKLRSTRDRLAVGAAGIVTELTVAAWATLAWGLLPDGTLRNMAFLLATTTWISTLIINASPFMRFDGYFLMSDYMDFPNLHNRSFALARWHLREVLFGLGEPVPEDLPRRRQRGLIIFAWMVWIYRLSLFIGIAILVYHFFIKLVGIALFVVEIGVFVALPVWREIKQWVERRDAIRQSRRARWSLLLPAMILLLGLLPLSMHLSGQGLLRTAQRLPIYAPSPARIVQINQPAKGVTVKAGDVLMTLDSPDTNFRLQQNAERLQKLGWQLEVGSFDDTLRARQGVTQEEFSGAQAEQSNLQLELQRFDVRAPFDGVLVDVSPELKSGVWVGRQERLGLLIAPNSWQVETYLEENEVHRVKLGDTAKFFPETPGKRTLKLRVIRIDSDSTRLLPEPMLAVQHGGQILSRERNGQLIPEKALYRVVLAVDPEELQDAAAMNINSSAERGHIVIHGAAQSLFGDYLRTVLAVIIREAGL
jgi:putative peptide zinc metalloprotease protein